MQSRATLHRRSNALLHSLLEEPGLDQWVQRLPGPEWKALVRHVGLEDSSELLALSSPEQLVELIDETLWVGELSDELDVERFSTLLEVLHDAGARQLAEKVAGLPEEFLIMAFSRLVSVWPAEFLRQLAEVDESGVLDKRLESQMFEDFDDYTILSPSGLAWDALLALLSTWSDSHPDLLERLLLRLSAANISGIAEPDELVTVLDEMAEFEEEAQAEREERRARSGYVAKSDAHAFLRLPPATRPGETDAISKAYFRRLRPEPVHAHDAPDPRLLELLRSHTRVDTATAHRRLSMGAGFLKPALDDLAARSPQRHTRALEELAFLTNVMGASLTDTSNRDGEPSALAIRAVVDAVEAAVVTPIALDRATSIKKLSAALEAHGPIALFRNRPR